jgi:hypothetical protein
MSEATYEMLWDCRFCSTPKLLGLTHRHCPNCGAPQDPSARYFPSDAEKVAVKDHVYGGADRLCPACATPGSAKANNCGHCGSPLDAGKAVNVRADQVHAEGVAFGAETAKDARAEVASRVAQPGMATEAAPAPKRSLFVPGLILGALVLMVAVFTLCLWTKPVALTVASHAWERSIEIEQRKEVRDSSWCNEMPSGASDVSRSKEVRSHRQVKDGETCATRRKDKGDGTFKEVRECSPKYKDEPVYDDKCSYRVTRWAHERSEKATGSSVKEAPTWPKVKLSRSGEGLGAEREGKRTEAYRVVLRDAQGKTHDCEYPEAKWAAMADGSRWVGQGGAITGAVSCDSLKPAR